MVMLLKAAKYDRAREVFNEVNDYTPDNNNIYTNYSYGLYSVGKYQEALEIVNGVSERNPQEFPALLLKALFSAGLEDFETADAMVQRCFQMVPDEPITYLIRAGVNHHKGDTVNFYKDIRLCFEKGFNNQSDLVSQVPYSYHHDEPEFQEIIKEFKIPIVEP